MMLIACLGRRLHPGVGYATFAGEPTLNAVYQVVADDDLSQPLRA